MIIDLGSGLPRARNQQVQKEMALTPKVPQTYRRSAEIGHHGVVQRKTVYRSAIDGQVKGLPSEMAKKHRESKRMTDEHLLVEGDDLVHIGVAVKHTGEPAADQSDQARTGQ